jgi:hypothetical protein
MKLTRRKLATAVLGAAAGAQAQTPQTTADEELRAARERLRNTLNTIAAEQVPIATEPAFQFKA